LAKAGIVLGLCTLLCQPAGAALRGLSLRAAATAQKITQNTAKATSRRAAKDAAQAARAARTATRPGQLVKQATQPALCRPGRAGGIRATIGRAAACTRS